MRRHEAGHKLEWGWGSHSKREEWVRGHSLQERVKEQSVWLTEYWRNIQKGRRSAEPIDT